MLDENGKRIHDVYAYRDARTTDAPDAFHQRIARSEVYAKTGIQELNFNTLYQLFVHDKSEISQAETILMVPDYLYFRLTGEKVNESTNASTTQMVNLKTDDYDDELLSLLQLRRDQFPEIAEPGTALGELLPELSRKFDLPQCQVILAPTHDTASAVVGVPAENVKPWAYLSSGTWSLLGVELRQPLNSEEAMKLNYTNERGAYGTYRFLKNIMGLWMIQEVRRIAGNAYSFAELVELAQTVTPFRSLVRCNDPRFLNPDNMVEEIKSFCRETQQIIPESVGEITRCVFDSLALTYRDYMNELEQLTNQQIDVLHIVGGGANNALLCQMTADLMGKNVQAGPSESTALGNLAVQLITSGLLPDMVEARKLIARSFPIETYEPRPVSGQYELIQRWRELSN